MPDKWLCNRLLQQTDLEMITDTLIGTNLFIHGVAQDFDSKFSV